MIREELKKQIEIIQLQIKILQLQLQQLLGQKVTIPGKNKPYMVVVHHGGGDLDFDGVNAWHKQKWGFKSALGYYVGYQKFIEFSGFLNIARRDDEEGAHTKGYNLVSIGICLQGNTELKQPTSEQLITLKIELDKYQAQGLKIKMHRNFAATLCPGRHLDQWLLDNYS